MTKAIVIENLSKKYVIGHQRQDQYTTFRDVLMHKLRGAGQRIRHPLAPNQEEIEQEELWALRDINLEIEQGERVGIIGRNGAGKSTLLKLLSRITEPTTGRFTMNGRVASLLEVGTGFHPELSGRENIFLNGAILGMSKAEISKKFDEIVAFAETEKFLDTPVKRYSSGMYVRLAFAVAAHLEPEILIVDEVLAVGDAAFQKKCLGKMREVGSEGRTVLFVSHNMAAIESLCDSVIVIDKGRSSKAKPPRAAIMEYASWSNEISNVKIGERTDRQGEGGLKVTGIGIFNSEGQATNSIAGGDSLRFRLRVESSEEFRHVRVIIGVYDYMNSGVLRFDTRISATELEIMRNHVEIECRTETIPLAPGDYFVNIALFDNSVMQDYVQHACKLSFVASNFFGTGKFMSKEDEKLMRVLVKHEWSVDSGQS